MRGADYKEILTHYYPGIAVEKNVSPQPTSAGVP
jgi:peptidoglycan hydrolase-like amidase